MGCNEQLGDADEQDSTIDRLVDMVELQAKQVDRLLEWVQGVQQSQQGASVDLEFWRFRKLDPPTFDGCITDSMEAEEWIRTLDDMFEFARISEEVRVFCAIYMLRKNARFWWDTMKTIHDVKTMSWAVFKEEFCRRFFNSAVRAAKETEFEQLNQTGSVLEYISRFEELSRFAPYMINTNELMVNQFVKRLKPEIYKDVMISGTKGASYSDIMERALVAEQAAMRTMNKKCSKRPPPEEANQSASQRIQTKVFGSVSTLKQTGGHRKKLSSSPLKTESR